MQDFSVTAVIGAGRLCAVVEAELVRDLEFLTPVVRRHDNGRLEMRLRVRDSDADHAVCFVRERLLSYLISRPWSDVNVVSCSAELSET